MRTVCNFQTKLDPVQLAFFESFFQNCPQTLVDHIIYETYPSDHTLMYTDDTCSFVYILLKGRIQAVEEKAAEFTYHFMEIPAIEILGDYELFTNDSSRLITLTTLEPSTCLVIPSVDYFAWIRKDADALFIRTQMLIRQLAGQTRLERQLFFMENSSRMLYFLFNEFNRQKQDCIKLPHTRSQIASKLGCSVRTVNRVIGLLQTEGLLSLVHGKIRIDKRQYEQIQAQIKLQDGKMI